MQSLISYYQIDRHTPMLLTLQLGTQALITVKVGKHNGAKRFIKQSYYSILQKNLCNTLQIF